MLMMAEFSCSDPTYVPKEYEAEQYLTESSRLRDSAASILAASASSRFPRRLQECSHQKNFSGQLPPMTPGHNGSKLLARAPQVDI